ncbi:MAG: RNA polymerase sigma factor [Ktedonobacteraceae bacterium]
MKEESATKQQLLEFLSEHTAPLLGTLRTYVQRLGLVMGDEASVVALDVLQETVVEALSHADRFDATRQPMAWLLGIAVNVIKRKKVEQAKRVRRELLLGSLSARYPEVASESDMLDLLIPATVAGPEQAVEADERACEMLSLVSLDDQQVLRLAFLEDFEREALARRLGTTTGAAGMRIHRALARLRMALNEQKKRRRGAEDE